MKMILKQMLKFEVKYCNRFFFDCQLRSDYSIFQYFP